MLAHESQVLSLHCSPHILGFLQIFYDLHNLLQPPTVSSTGDYLMRPSYASWKMSANVSKTGGAEEGSAVHFLSFW